MKSKESYQSQKSVVQTIKAGYKQTEIGLIPCDWEVKKLGEIVDKIIGGGTPSRSNKEFWGNEIPWVTVKDFATFNPNFTQEFITKKGLENSASHLIPKKTLITSTRMGLGKAVVYNVDVSINQDLKAIFPSKNLDTKYLYYWFQKNSEIIERLGSGSTVMGISLIELKNIQFVLPTLTEQTLIATALSDTDALISSLEKLIAKKRNIKQGAMQKCLNPDFYDLDDDLDLTEEEKSQKPINQKNHSSDKWEVKKLGEVCENISSGKSNTQSQDGQFPIFGSTGIIGWSKSSDYGGHKILVARVGANAGTVNIVDGKYCVSDNTLMISLNPEIDLKFVFSFLILFQLNKLVFGSGQPLITGGQLKNIEIPIPKSKQEQTRIATILSDMDAEITALETKLEKYKKVKLGMMQNLLTGKIRLV
jgi:type I restriction enzyme S subunit